MSIFKIINQNKIAENVYEMTLSGDTAKIINPGQFVNLKLPEHFLRRPISVCDWNKDTLKLIYKVVGVGTSDMSKLPKGYEIDILTGLGNGFTIRNSKNPLIVGGGVGLPPMYGLLKRMLEKGIKPIAVMGFTSSKDVFYVDEFKKLGVEVLISTNDGTVGTKGFVTDIIDEIHFDYFYACGPLPMLKALCKYNVPAQFSLEERMGCGFGACMGCSIETKSGNKRVCKEGPIFEKEELIWPI